MTIKGEVRIALANNPGMQFTSMEMARHIGHPERESAVSQAFSTLVKDGAAVRIAWGVYRAPQAARTPLAAPPAPSVLAEAPMASPPPTNPFAALGAALTAHIAASDTARAQALYWAECGVTVAVLARETGHPVAVINSLLAQPEPPILDVAPAAAPTDPASPAFPALHPKAFDAPFPVNHRAPRPDLARAMGAAYARRWAQGDNLGHLDALLTYKARGTGHVPQTIWDDLLRFVAAHHATGIADEHNTHLRRGFWDTLISHTQGRRSA